MAEVRYQGRVYSVHPGESVLDALLRQGVRASHACKAGSCGSCMLRREEGAVPPRAQEGLKDSWKANGYFLACMCHPEGDLSVEAAGADVRIPAVIIALRLLSADVLEVRLRPDAPFEFRAGQYVSLILDDGLSRSYSIASLPAEGEIALHVRRIANGLMSGWLFEEARPGARVHLQGPSGDCFYIAGRETQPMLLVGTGTGLAPLWGIARDALASGHTGPIHLIHGAVREEGLYLTEALAALAAAHWNFDYIPSLLDQGPIDSVLGARFPVLGGWRGFVCGDPAIVGALRKKLFLAGMAMRDIHADAFLPAQEAS